MIMIFLLFLILLSSFLNICTLNVIDYPLSFSVVSLSLQVLNNNLYLSYYNSRDAKFIMSYSSSDHTHYLLDDKEKMVNTLKNHFIGDERCFTAQDILSFFHNNKRRIYKNCTDFRVYSHCQEYYLFQFDSSRKVCHSYYHEEYIDKNFTGITETLVLTPNRLDRLPLHLDRWDGRMSIAIQLNENELPTVAQVICSINRPNIRFTLYVVKKRSGNSGCNYVSKTKKVIHFNQCFVINELRNLAIETIQTTNFMVIDGDGILSKTIVKNVNHFKQLLTNEREILLFPLFQSHSSFNEKCISIGNCTEAWKALPQTKEELLKDHSLEDDIIPSYLFYDIKKWKKEKRNRVMKALPKRSMEPYGIFKRTRSLPLFHPYFINYMGNKLHYYTVLNTMNYHYNVLSQDFAVNLPHPHSSYKQFVYDKANMKASYEFYELLYKLRDKFCKTHICNVVELK